MPSMRRSGEAPEEQVCVNSLVSYTLGAWAGPGQALAQDWPKGTGPPIGLSGPCSPEPGRLGSNSLLGDPPVTALCCCQPGPRPQGRQHCLPFTDKGAQARAVRSFASGSSGRPEPACGLGSGRQEPVAGKVAEGQS